MQPVTATLMRLRRLREWYFRTPLYRVRLAWRQRRTTIRPVDLPWQGNPDDGRATAEGTITTAGVAVAATATAWDRVPEEAWQAETLHGFAWLRDLMTVGGEAARLTGRDLIDRWLDRHDRWHPLVWRGDVLGERLCNWLAAYDFFYGSADQQSGRRVLDSAARQAIHAPYALGAAPDGIRRLRALRGLVLSGIALDDGERRFAVAETRLLREIEGQIHGDGGHRSRSPARHCEALMAMIDIRNGLRLRNRPVPDALDQAINRMARALRLWRHGDNGLAVFHQSTARPVVSLDSLLAWSDARSRTPGDAPDTGFQRLSNGRVCVILDSGMPGGFDDAGHASPLAMEVSVGRQRLIVNCGTNHGERRWRDALRASAAHSMLVIDNRDAAAAEGALDPPSVTVTSRRIESNGDLVLETEHDGYRARFGLICHRWLCLSGNGEVLEGLDRLAPVDGAAIDEPVSALIRFHLHPDLTARVAPDSRSAALAIPSHDNWRLWSDATLALEESVYFGDGNRRKTGQVVIFKTIDKDDETVVRWALHRDDARDRRFPRMWRDGPDDRQEDDHGRG